MRKFTGALAILFLCAPLAWARPKQAVSSAAAAQLRRDYYLQDRSRVVADGKPLLKQYPNDLELRAWYVLAEPYGNDVGDVVEQMKKTGATSPWTLLADAARGSNPAGFQAKLDMCEKAIAGAKDDPDVLVLATGIVQEAAYEQSFSEHPPSADALKHFLAEHKGAYKRSPDALAAEAHALDIVACIEKNTKSTDALKLADRVLKSDPICVSALLLKSQILVKKRDFQDDYDLLKAAAHAMPGSYALHEAYWKAVLALPKANPDEQKQEILADAGRILSAAKPTTNILESSLFAMKTASPALATALGDLIIQRYPNTAVEDGVRYTRALLIEPVTEDERDFQIAALESFLDRPQHHDADLLRSANSILADDLAEQKAPDLNRLYAAEMATDTGSHPRPPADGIVTLADHKSHLPEIGVLARKQLDAQWTALQNNLKNTPDSQVKGSVQSFLHYSAPAWLDAVGWVELQEGKLDAAQPDLEEAAKLSPQDPQVTIHLGHVYEARGESAKAEKTYLSAFAMPYYGEGDHPAIAALQELYAHTHGGGKGLDAYLQPILARDAARRKTAVLGERMKPEKPLKTFELASLDGTEVGSQGLKGKYLILNFWATW